MPHYTGRRLKWSQAKFHTLQCILGGNKCSGCRMLIAVNVTNQLTSHNFLLSRPTRNCWPKWIAKPYVPHACAVGSHDPSPLHVTTVNCFSNSWLVTCAQTTRPLAVIHSVYQRWAKWAGKSTIMWRSMFLLEVGSWKAGADTSVNERTITSDCRARSSLLFG